jgi:sodium/potassium/calcium exchanger 6
MPDLVADVVMAKQGYPQMALGHCYGGPLFNMFFGLSVALVLKATETIPDPIDISGIANEAFFVLLAVVVGVLLAISFAFYFDFSPPKTYSYVMIGYYVSITLCNIMMEAGVFSFPSLKFST